MPPKRRMNKMRYRSQYWFLSSVLFLSVLFAAASPAQAAMSTWKDVQGAAFRGDPTEIMGPFVLFRTGNGHGRHVLLRAFSPEDCRRLQAEIASHPPLAASFAEAKGRATAELLNNIFRVEHKKLVPADLVHSPEPELLLVLCGSHNDGDGWFMASNLNPFYRRVQRVYPGLMEAVFLGVRHDAGQHNEIATQSDMPWLVADFAKESTMPTLNYFIPWKEGSSVALVSRQGVPLVTAPAGDAQSVALFF